MKAATVSDIYDIRNREVPPEVQKLIRLRRALQESIPAVSRSEQVFTFKVQGNLGRYELQLESGQTIRIASAEFNLVCNFDQSVDSGAAFHLERIRNGRMQIVSAKSAESKDLIIAVISDILAMRGEFKAENPHNSATLNPLLKFFSFGLRRIF